MKRQQTSFSVEIKKSRTQAQRHHLPPRPLFEVVPPAAEAPQILQNEAMPKVAEPTSAPRILPSIVEPMWSRSEPAEPTRRTRSSGETKRGQMEFDLNAASEDGNDAPAETPVHAVVALPTAIAAAVEKGATATHDVQPASGKSAKSHARTVRKKAPAAVAPAQAPEPAPEAQPTRHAGMIEPSTAVPSTSSERRLTKRLAAAGQLPRTSAGSGASIPHPGEIISAQSQFEPAALATAWQLPRSDYRTLMQLRPSALAAYRARSARCRMAFLVSWGRASVRPALNV